MSNAEFPEQAESEAAVELRAAIAARINVAFHQNSVPAVSEIVLINDTDENLGEVTISVSAIPSFLRAVTFPLAEVRPHTTQRLSPVPVELNASFLLSLTEAVRGEITLVASAPDRELVRLVRPCEILSPSEWTGLAGAPELIAAFVRPNDPSIEVTLRKAAGKLRLAGRDPSLDGYSSGKKARAWEVAEAIWATLCDEQIVYALPPQSFERNGQKVRSPAAVLERRIGTCLDLVLLFASALEQAGLNPLVGLCEGHAFVGLWLVDEEFSTVTLDEPQPLRKRMQLDELILIETTLLTNQPPLRFRAAVGHAAKLVAEDAEKRFEAAVDVRRARHRQVRPMDLGADPASSPAIDVPTVEITATIEPAPQFAEDMQLPERPAELPGRLERWKRGLLDLSLRNRLLNFKPTKATVRLVCTDPAALVALLAEGRQIKLLSAANVMAGADPRSPQLHLTSSGHDPRESYAAEALQQGDVHTDLASDELEARLIEINRLARASLEEGGANSLYLAIGFVSWAPQGKQQTCKAPLLLVPVGLERKSVRSGFRLVHHDEDPRVNPTLLQMMRQDFGLVVSELEQESPIAADAADVLRILRIARENLKEVKSFEVTDEVVLANFSFNKYLMWKDLVDRTDVLKRNPVVRHLIDTPKETYGDGNALPDERQLDEEVHPKELTLPLPADSSQTVAVVAASRGKDFVLFGPPGTGKSQTIANIIAQLLSHGKTVLFVSAKTTALAVVRHRLDEIGLGSFCLEVHSAKAQKRVVLDQLQAAWDSQKEAVTAAWDAATSDIEALRDRLNGVVTALHRRHANGLTAHLAMGRVIAGRWFLPGFTIPFDSPDQHDEAALAHLRQLCETLRIALGGVGEPSGNPLAGIGRAAWSPSWQKELIANATRFEERAGALREAAAALADLLNAPASGDPRRLRGLLGLAAQALQKEATIGAPLLGPDRRKMTEAFAAWKEIKKRYQRTTSSVVGTYRDAVFSLDLAELRNEWREACAANILTRGGRKKRVRQALMAFTDRSLPADLGPELGDLIELRSLREAAAPHDEVLSPLGAVWQGMSTQAEAIEALFVWASETQLAAGRLKAPDHPPSFWIASLASLIPTLGEDCGAATQDFRAATACTTAAYETFEGAWHDLVRYSEATDEWLGQSPGESWITDAADAAHGWYTYATALPHWCKWQEVALSASQAGLAPLVSALASGAIAPDDAIYAFDIGYARWWVDQVVEQEEALRGFIAEQHDHQIARFEALDRKIADLAKKVVSAQLSANIPSRANFGKDSEYGLLARQMETKSKARRLPLRQLFAQIPGALATLAPCMMMSPLSVAQYLPAEARPFDAVVFDEASQLPVWDAIGAIARGNQTIIVGDPKQLPPTAFFERAAEGYDEASDLEDLDSILDECIAANLPSKRLAWHYRSRHESLIAFSNARYYAGRLVTFPSPVTADRAVHYIHVPGGVYERGSARVNREEAQAVARDVTRRLTDPDFARTNSSLGIVAMNSEQQHLIETMLDQERRMHPDLDRFFGTDWHEPVFVKNLESVQGDERDVILLSVTYGPDDSGRVSHNFGPLNKDSGTRRLNVAITRARAELAVFATLHPDQIDLSKTKSAGARDFKHFLEYAQHGARALTEAAAPTGRDTESPLEDAVRQALVDRGWTVHPQVGAAGFRVDLGVVHPNAPGRYLAGIECDGATYHRSATARDRDILRERVLRNLGWQIHRVWSHDWWIDADRALARLINDLEMDLASDPPPAIEPAPHSSSDTAVDATAAMTPPESDAVAPPPEPESPAEAHTGASRVQSASHYAGGAATAVAPKASDEPGNEAERNYRIADLREAGFVPDQDAFYEATYLSTLRGMAAHIIATEGPIFADVLVHRIASAHGFGRAGGQIRRTILGAINEDFPQSDEDGRVIFWPQHADPRQPSPFRADPLGNRNHADIPLVELAMLARRLLHEGKSEGEIPALIACKLGLERLRKTSLARFHRAVSLAKKHPI